MAVEKNIYSGSPEAEYGYARTGSLEDRCHLLCFVQSYLYNLLGSKPPPCFMARKLRRL